MSQYDRIPALIVLLTFLCCGALGSILWARYGCSCEWRCPWRGWNVFGRRRRTMSVTTHGTLAGMAARLLAAPPLAAPPPAAPVLLMDLLPTPPV
jgi:hypothetical protein